MALIIITMASLGPAGQGYCYDSSLGQNPVATLERNKEYS